MMSNEAYWREKYEQLKAQRQWIGLTEKEQDEVFKTFSRYDAQKFNFLNRIASAIEEKLKEKNNGN
jgi:hypothetical protein